MTYADLSKQVRILWTAARYGWDIDAAYVEYLEAKVIDALTVPDDVQAQYRDHLAFDYGLDTTEAQRFRFWWGHVVDKGFGAGNPLANLHRKKVGAK